MERYFLNKNDDNMNKTYPIYLLVDGFEQGISVDNLAEMTILPYKDLPWKKRFRRWV